MLDDGSHANQNNTKSRGYAPNEWAMLVNIIRQNLLPFASFSFGILAGVLAVDVSRWNVNKRQLQNQADAAALAGAAAFQFPCNATVETATGSR